MKNIKKFLKLIDVFAVPLSFRYKGKNYYATSLGGVCIILFLIVILVVGIYYSIPFLNRKNFTIVYYTQNLSKTEQIKFKDSNAAFAYGFDCGKIVNGLSVSDVLSLESRYIIYKKFQNGSIYKEQFTLPTHNCNYADFYYRYNNSVDYLNLGKYQCLDDNSHTIEGIFADQVFSYYEFAAVAKYGTEQNYKDIDTFLLYNDCKFQFYYTDITFDLVDYKEPIKPYLNSIFIQFDLTLFIKRNVFFMNQYLYNDDYLIWNFGDDDVPDVKTLFSRYEEYALYQGRNRTYSLREDRNNFARIYIRADTKRTDVKRRYQKLMEFYADLSSLMITLYRIMIIFFNYINTFYAMHSVSKRIFFFRDIERKRHYNFNKSKNIYELIYLTEPSTKINLEEESLPSGFNNENSSKKNEDEKQTDESKKLKENSSRNNEKISNKNNPPPKNNIYNQKKSGYDNRGKYYEKDINSSQQSKILKYNNMKENRINSIYKRKDPDMDEYKDINLNMKIHQRNRDYIYSSKSNYIDKININNSDRTRMDEHPRKKQRQKKINYNFNLFEAIFVSFCFCCLTKKLDRKNNINEKANDVIFKKLDLVLFVRNMILFDIINDMMLSWNKRNIINFLSRPVISLNNDEEYRSPEFYQDYNRNDYERFSQSIYDMAQEPQKGIEEKKLIALSNKSLKYLA